jgi:hypothetical protein
MSPRVTITVLIITAISVGIGACTFGILTAVLYSSREKESTIIAIGVTLVTAGLSALIARFYGGFREIEDRDD